MQIRWTPFNEIARLQNDLDRLFGGSAAVDAWNPHFDLTEDADKITLTADVPGVKQDQLDLSVEQNVLTIKGSRKERTFSRAFKLSPHVDPEKITAKLEDGVLTVVLAKRPEAQPRQIKIAVQ
jgi:HSP20 family protein